MDGISEFAEFLKKLLKKLVVLSVFLKFQESFHPKFRIRMNIFEKCDTLIHSFGPS